MTCMYDLDQSHSWNIRVDGVIVSYKYDHLHCGVIVYSEVKDVQKMKKKMI